MAWTAWRDPRTRETDMEYLPHEKSMIYFVREKSSTFQEQSMQFYAYLTNDPNLAVKLYKEATGQEPTAVVIRPDFVVSCDHRLIFRSRFGAAGIMCVTHLVGMDELRKREEIASSESVRKSICYGSPKKDKDFEEKHLPHPPMGRPRHNGGQCPHCGHAITNFDKLGHWYGWVVGQYPPYWDALRMYVFRRDAYTCLTCQKRFPPDRLRCHHVIPKEIGGTDSAKNLVTMCAECHPDEHPIFPDQPT